MTLRCKPGDLALIVSCVFPENLGAIVTVRELERPDTWIVEVTGRPLKCGDAFGNVWMTDKLPKHVRITMPDRCLQPLRPDPNAADELLKSWLPDMAIAE